MFLLDGNCSEGMERGTPQRKTVYRISLTLVKKETLEDGDGTSEKSKVGVFRQQASLEAPRCGPLEQLEEVENESRGVGELKEFTKPKQLQSPAADRKRRWWKKGPKFKHFLSVLFWAHCHCMAFSLLHRKEWI